MRVPMLKILACLLAVSVVAVSVAEAGQRTGSRKSRKSRPDIDKAYSLEDIMKEPKTYLEREVFFYCRFATTANLFKNVNTRFNVNEHVNFAVWPDKAILWEEKGRKNILPTLYVSKIDPDNVELMRDLGKYELIAVTGRVLNVYAGYPWIQITQLERVEIPSDRICETTIEHMQSGYDALRAEAGGTAARHFEQALQFGLPKEFRAKAYEQIAQAYLLDNRLDKARTYLRQAVEENGGDSILHLALADVALKMGDAAEALAHCEFALQNSGRHPQVYGIMGEARSLMEDFVKGFRDLNTAAGSPGITAREKAMIGVRRARIYVRSGRFPDAARAYVAVSEPGEPLAAEGWLHNEIGLFYERQYLETGEAAYLESAYASYEEASRLSRLDASILYNMAEVELRRQHLREEPNFTLVKELIERIHQVEPDYVPARIIEGRVFFFEKKITEAEARYQSVANEISDHPASLMALSEAYLDLGRYRDAARTVRRARALQPWNPRVQILGKFIADTAEAIARSEEEARLQAEYYHPEPAAPEYLPEPYPDPAVETRDARHTRRPAPAERDDTYRFVGEPAHPADPRPVDRPAREPLVAGARPPYAPADRRPEGTQVRVRPGEGIRAGVDGVARAAPGDRREYRDFRDYPQDIQTAAGPAPVPGRIGRSLPATEVRLDSQPRPEAVRPGPRPLNLGYTPADAVGEPEEAEYLRPASLEREPWYEALRPREERVTEREPDRPEPPRFGEQRYEPRRSEPAAAPEPEGSRRDTTRRPDDRERQGPAYDREYDAEYDDDGYLRFGWTTGSGEAYASLPLFATDHPNQNDEGARIPEAFTFAPDPSPVIIAGVVAPTMGGRDLPVRNANVFRPLAGGRQPAEIIEKEPVDPDSPRDTSVMAPPGSGGMPRTEVHLPSSSMGIGQANEYIPGR